VRRIATSGLVAVAALLGGTVPALTVGAATRQAAITADAATREAAATSVPVSAARLAAPFATTVRTAASARSPREITVYIFVADRISCASPTACLAVGLNFDSSGRPTTPAAESLHGTAWRPVAVNEPKGAAGAMLNGVSCKAATYLPGRRRLG